MLFKDLNYGCFFTVNSEKLFLKNFPAQKNCFIKVSPFRIQADNHYYELNSISICDGDDFHIEPFVEVTPITGSIELKSGLFSMLCKKCMIFEELDIGSLFKLDVGEKKPRVLFEKLDDERARNIDQMYIIKVCPEAKVIKVGD